MYAELKLERRAGLLRCSFRPRERVDLFQIILPLAIGWLVLSMVVAALWALLRSRLPHPDEFLDDDDLLDDYPEAPRRERDVA